MKRVLLVVSLSLVSLVLSLLLFFWAYFRHSVPGIEGRASFKNLRSVVKVLRDPWGIPHVFAQNEEDLFFAWGYVHAQDRMWQMDFHRRVGFGRLSEIFGKEVLAKDKIIRNFGLNRAVLEDEKQLSAELRNLLHAYTRGVNSWLNSRKFNWPPEFFILRYRPEPWRLLDSLVIKEVMALFMCLEYQYEVFRAKLIESFGVQKGLQVLEEEVMVPAHEIGELSLSDVLSLPGAPGSNDWVLAGSRTESQKPLLANDPHLGISLPSIFHEIHLSCPTLNVMGVSIPGIPVVIIGHNDTIAWGLTYSTADAQDLFIERLNVAKDMYLDQGEWRPLLKEEQEIKIRGKRRPEVMEILWTERGPLISPLIIASQKPISLGWTIYEGGRTFESFCRLNKAQNWDEFKAAVSLFDAPSHNIIYADMHGNIGYHLCGKIPIRLPMAALFPYPGWEKDGQWQGFLAEDNKPSLYNPEEGYIVTANNRVIPDGFPYYVSLDWDVPFRAERIKELILEKKIHTIETQKRIQNDIFSKKAEIIFPYLDNMEGESGIINEAVRCLKAWDREMGSSQGAAFFGVFMNIFHEEVFQDELGKDFKRFDLLFRRKKAGLLRILSDPRSPWFDNIRTSAVEAREDIIKASLEKTFHWLEKAAGSPENWNWMELYSITLQHVLSRSPLLKFLNRGPYAVDGRYFTVKASYAPDYYNVTYGPSYRQIIDLSNFGNSISVITSGESGHFLSRFYADQTPLWLEGDYHPLLFSQKEIEAKAEGVFLLEPLSSRADREE